MRIGISLRQAQLAILPVCLGFAVIGADEASAATAMRALVIGVNEYSAFGKEQQLANAVNDANAIGKAFEKLGFIVSVRANRSRSQIYEDIGSFRRQITKGDIAVFFFAGHGIAPEKMNEDFLLPSDVPQDEYLVGKSGIKISEIQADILEAEPQLALLIIDACRNDPYSKGRSLARGIGFTRPLKQSAIVYAASRGQQALDGLGQGDDEQNGLFTRTFVRQLAPNKSMFDILDSVRAEVSRQAKLINRVQEPIFSGEDVLRDIVLKQNSFEIVYRNPVEEAALKARKERELYREITKSTNPDVCQTYLRDYPNSIYAPMVADKCAALLAKALRPGTPDASGGGAGTPRKCAPSRYLDCSGLVPGTVVFQVKGDEMISADIVGVLPMPRSSSALKPEFFTDGLFGQAMRGETQRFREIGGGVVNSLVFVDVSNPQVSAGSIAGVPTVSAQATVRVVQIDGNSGNLLVNRTESVTKAGFSELHAGKELRKQIALVVQETLGVSR